MKRQYTRAEYLDLVARLRAAVPGLALSTDVIVGFPGETETDFDETLSLFEEVRFAGVFSFTYSPRPQTAALRWEHDVTPQEASARLARLEALQQEVQRELNRAPRGTDARGARRGSRPQETQQLGPLALRPRREHRGGVRPPARHARGRANRAGISELSARKKTETEARDRRKDRREDFFE